MPKDMKFNDLINYSIGMWQVDESSTDDHNEYMREYPIWIKSIQNRRTLYISSITLNLEQILIL